MTIRQSSVTRVVLYVLDDILSKRIAPFFAIKNPDAVTSLPGLNSKYYFKPPSISCFSAAGACHPTTWFINLPFLNRQRLGIELMP